MSRPSSFKINLKEKFPHLKKAPIVEAIIEILARAEMPLEEEYLKSELQSRLSGYSFLDSQREFQQELKLGPGQVPSQTIKDLGWKGVRFQSNDKLHIARFGRDEFSFSRLYPYDSWEQLSVEAIRLWDIYAKLAQPTEIHRLGLRFINRLDVLLDELNKYLYDIPLAPGKLPLPVAKFFHHGTLSVPNYPYLINVVETIQRAPVGESNNVGFVLGSLVGLILDIDVFSTQLFKFDKEHLTQCLAQMRWLKNKVFFSSIKLKAVKEFK